jgi:hypothetical protein
VNETKILLVIHGGAAKSGRLTRREMVQRLLAGVGAGAAWPLVAAGHPIHEHLANGAIFEEAEKLGAADWKPLFLRAEQNEALVALSEGIVPGSIKAQVNRFIDLLLSVDTTEHRQKFAESLEAFDAEAQKRFGKRFAVLDEACVRPANAAPVESDSSAEDGPSSAAAGKNQRVLYDHFENLKGWISGVYYSTEAGMRELGWNGEYVFESFPGCEHPDGHD